MIGGEGRGRASDRSFAMVVAFGVGWCLISGGVCGVRLGHGCGGGVEWNAHVEGLGNNIVGIWVIVLDMLLCWRLLSEWPSGLFQVLPSITKRYVCRC